MSVASHYNTIFPFPHTYSTHISLLAIFFCIYPLMLKHYLLGLQNEWGILCMSLLSHLAFYLLNYRSVLPSLRMMSLLHLSLNCLNLAKWLANNKYWLIAYLRTHEGRNEVVIDQAWVNLWDHIHVLNTPHHLGCVPFPYILQSSRWFKIPIMVIFPKIRKERKD